MSDRFVVLRDGRNAGEGRDRRDVSGDQIVSLMVGRALDDLYPRGPRTIGEPMLELDGLCARAARVRRRSRCIAARFSASPGCWAPAARACFAGCSAWTPSRADR